MGTTFLHADGRTDRQTDRRTDGRTGRHDEVNCSLLALLQMRQK